MKLISFVRHDFLFLNLSCESIFEEENEEKEKYKGTHTQTKKTVGDLLAFTRSFCNELHYLLCSEKCRIVKAKTQQLLFPPTGASRKGRKNLQRKLWHGIFIVTSREL